MRGKGQIKHPIPQANTLIPWLCVGINTGELGGAKSQPRPMTKRSVWFTLQNSVLKCLVLQKQEQEFFFFLNPCVCNPELTL